MSDITYILFFTQVLCKGYSRILLPELKVDAKRSQVVCPRSTDDVKAFIEESLGRNFANKGAADLVLLDQNIDLADNKVGSVLFPVCRRLCH